MSSSREPAGRYEICVQGHLGARWAAWFDGLTLVRTTNGTTVISGQVADQAALHGLIEKVRDTGLPLISVRYVAPRPAVDEAGGTSATMVPAQPS
jgi:hypothetical protein